jgi:hypothetical protein
MISLVIEYQPHRTLAQLRGKPVRRLARHGSVRFGRRSLRQTRGGSNPIDEVPSRTARACKSGLCFKPFYSGLASPIDMPAWPAER